MADRWMKINAPLCDGTPRRERGFRVYVEYPFKYSAEEIDKQPGLRYIKSVIAVSPLFSSKAEADQWTPRQEA